MTAPRAAPRLDIRLLGPPEVLVDGSPLAVDTRKAVAILALLGAEGRPFARDELAAMLWPDAGDTAARGALRRTISTLRAATGEATVLVDRSKVALADEGVRVDVADLHQLAASDARRSLAAAAQLARGPFLAGFNLRDSPEFDDWRAARAVAIERSMMNVLDRLAAACEAAGDLDEAIAAADRRLDLDPLDEAGHVRMMALLARSGDRAAALRQYRVCVAILDRELSVAPLASTTARYETIRDAPQTVQLGGPVPIAAPDPHRAAPSPPERRLVGRADALALLAAAYAATAGGAGRVAVITGEAGIGKTRLGEAIVDHVRERGGTVLATRAYVGERGIAYGPIVDLLRTALASPGLVDRVEDADRAELARLLPAVDARHRPVEPAADGPGAHARLVAAIADGLTALADGPTPGLLWIDDIHWADSATLEAVDYLARRLDGRPMLVLLAWRVEDLDDVSLAVASRLAGPPASVVELRRLDRDAVAELAADSVEDASLIDRLVAASEGLPLYVVEALAAGDDALTLMPVGVRAVLRARLRSVGETAGQVLTAASVIGRSFDLATVRHVSGRSEVETLDAIDESLRRGLIREQSGGFDFAHGGLRELAYAAASLARRRLLHRRAAEAFRLDLAGSGRDDLARLALIAAHERDGGRSAEAAAAFRRAGERAAAVFANREAIDHDEAALALGHPDGVGLHASIGRLRTRLGDYTGAIAALEAAAATAEPDALANLERAIAHAHLRRGDLVAADRHLEAALAGTSDAESRARALVDRSVVRRRTGDGAGAAEAARTALEEATSAGDLAAAGAAHRMLGLIALDAGDAETARQAAEAAVVAAADDPDPAARIAALAVLAMAYAAAGAIDAAMRHGDAAVAACQRIGDRHLEAAVENHLADLLHAARREDEALTHLRRSVEAFAEVDGDPADPDPGIWMLSAS